MTDEGVLYVQEHLPDVLGEELDAAFGGSNWRLAAGWDWHTNVEQEYPSSDEIPVVRSVLEDGTEVMMQVGVVRVELESVVKQDVWGGEYVGKELDSYEVEAWDEGEWAVYEGPFW